MARLRIGSRGSQLALWQANHIAARLGERGHRVEIEIIRTTGDKITDVALAQVGAATGGKGIFTKEIEEALAARRVDLAVHSLKDLPTELPAQFELAAVTEREDARDVLLLPAGGAASAVSTDGDGIESLSRGARVGTSSLRRQAQLKARRPDLEVVALRGNVDTRVRKLREGQFDALVLAAAGLNRLGAEHAAGLARQVIAPSEMCPAAGQGALGIEIRAGDASVRGELEFLNHPATRAAVTAERALLEALGGGCQVPIGAFAQMESRTSLNLMAAVASPDGAKLVRGSGSGHDPVQLGKSVASELLAKGAREILDTVYGRKAAVPEQP
ncbi:MAG TPA: hydroxymethylbilane synthase [Terriglobales bacterium]|nr:hydroxymethylbilane synthase [Terriglobales bacterium]